MKRKKGVIVQKQEKGKIIEKDGKENIRNYIEREKGKRRNCTEIGKGKKAKLYKKDQQNKAKNSAIYRKREKKRAKLYWKIKNEIMQKNERGNKRNKKSEIVQKERKENGKILSNDKMKKNRFYMEGQNGKKKLHRKFKRKKGEIMRKE